MAGFRLKVEGLLGLRRQVGATRRDMRRDMRDRMPRAVAMIIGAIRRGNFFDNPTGKLQRTMRPGRLRFGVNDVGQTVDWGVPYGRVLEFGPARKRVWEIFPRNASVLRFVAGGRTVFARRVVHRWTKAELRPHVGPTLDGLRGRLAQELGKPPRVLFRRFR